jgi:hypothetical protein
VINEIKIILMVLMFSLFIINLIFSNYYYFVKVRKDKSCSFLPSKQHKEIKYYLLNNKVNIVGLYFLKYSFFVNFFLLALWFFILFFN